MSKLLLPRGYRNAELLQRNLHNIDEEVWIRRGSKRALNLFHSMATRVPAYKDFLKSKKFSPSKVKTPDDFKFIPTVDKDNYLRKYPYEMLCWDGEFSHGQWVISTTSGSTGKPYYFPRENSQDWQYAIMAELYLRNNFQIHNKRTLYIVAFPMGAWIGGLFTYEALKIVAENGGYDLSIITPGIHKQEVINAVKQLGDSYEQIIIGAYAPFLKDILDDGIREGVNWSKYNLGFVFSAEAFSETFRDYVFDITKPDNPILASLNHYGTVDLGTMAHETPESVLIRRELVNSNKLGDILPELNRQPTLAQYDPALFFFEEVNHNLLCTAYSGIPLVRYDLKDYGGVINRKELHEKLTTIGLDINKEAQKNNIEVLSWNLPYVYVYERNDFSVSYYAFLVYPDTVRRVIQAKNFGTKVTGKFTMLADYDNEGRQKLHINIELKHGIKKDEELRRDLQQKIHEQLLRESSEYNETSKLIGDSIKPTIELWDYEHAEYFRPGTKQKWVIR